MIYYEVLIKSYHSSDGGEHYKETAGERKILEDHNHVLPFLKSKYADWKHSHTRLIDDATIEIIYSESRMRSVVYKDTVRINKIESIPIAVTDFKRRMLTS